MAPWGRNSRERDQGQYASCWTFSTVVATEGITRIAKNKLVLLSEQELVDCDTEDEDHGCDGEYIEDGFKFIKQNGGITTEANYPCTTEDGTCNTQKEASHVAKITGYEVVPDNNEEALLKAVAHQTIAVSIDATGSEFQLYESRVFTGECGTDLDHDVTAIDTGQLQMAQSIGLCEKLMGRGRIHEDGVCMGLRRQRIPLMSRGC